MSLVQQNAIKEAHLHLAELVADYNNFELTSHDWEAVVKVVKNMELWFDFLEASGVELTRTE
jgi:hypothetical protein